MNRSPLAPLHEAAGARLRELEGGAVDLLTYGDVPAEYEAATQSGAVLFDVTGRGLLKVTGAEAADFLHKLLSNPVRTLEVGEGSTQMLLTPKGKVRFTFDLERSADGFLLSTVPGGAAPLAEAIEMYHFTEDVAIEDVTQEHAPLEICGPKAEDIVKGRDLGAPKNDPEAPRVSSREIAGSAGWRLDAGPSGVEALWKELVAAGARPAGRAVRDILRVEACVAEPGVDIDENIYPQEARMHDAYSDDKGCYIGQEVVAKIDTYGGLNKRLVALRVSHDDFVPRGTPLVKTDEKDGEVRELGLVTSWAYSFVFDTGLCLAYVKRRHQAVGGEFHLGSADGPKATVVEMPVRKSALPVQGEFE